MSKEGGKEGKDEGKKKFVMQRECASMKRSKCGGLGFENWDPGSGASFQRKERSVKQRSRCDRRIQK